MNLNDFRDQIHKNAVEHGFHDQPFDDWFPIACVNLFAEVSELWEAYRCNELNAHCDKPSCSLSCQEEELADIIIRAFDMAGRMGLNIQNAINVKMTYNTTRRRLHGKKN